MPVPFQCSECGFTTKVKDELAGRKIKCPKCQAAGVVGGGGGGAAAAAPRKKGKSPAAGDSEENLMAINLESYKDAEVPEGEALEEAQAAKKPKAKKKKKGTALDPQVKLAAIGFSLLSLLVIAGLVYFAGPVVMEELQAATSTPDTPLPPPQAGGAAGAPAAP